MATAWRASGSTTPVVSDCKSETTESTFENCIEVRAELSNTDGLYKMMQNESERYVSHEPAFYYHTDHLGSTSRFTDDSGKVVQTLAYMPYGEDWVDDSKFIYSDTNHIGIYQFNGKERDFESGFYYYGARYHWPELWTGWTTPDPLMDKYPGISPYNYCTWNPVIFVDPDGREIKNDWVKNLKTRQYEWNDNATSQDNTPDGYRYVGNEYDLLRDLNIKTNYMTKTKINNGYSPSKSNNHFGFTKSKNITNATIRVSVCTRFDKNNISSENTSGRTFDGINIT